jgi:NADH-quinone oxidoreductase subunit M
LFTLVDIIEKRTGTRKISELGGLASQSKELAVVFMIVLLGAVALPLTNGFIGEFLLLWGVYQFNATLAAFAGLTIIFGAVYLFRMYRNVFYGEAVTGNAIVPFSWFEKSSLYILVALIIVLGFFPGIISMVSNNSGSQILQFIQQHSTITGL